MGTSIGERLFWVVAPLPHFPGADSEAEETLAHRGISRDLRWASQHHGHPQCTTGVTSSGGLLLKTELWLGVQCGFLSPRCLGQFGHLLLGSLGSVLPLGPSSQSPGGATGPLRSTESQMGSRWAQTAHCPWTCQSAPQNSQPQRCATRNGAPGPEARCRLLSTMLGAH